ncbi:MAG: endo-1,4-beta-xylanase [Halioglobus sp.]|nr:endo-1,4-beta-xylanase [Halioglobus sp.]
MKGNTMTNPSSTKGPSNRSFLALLALTATLLITACDDGHDARPSLTLRELADQRGILIGAAARPGLIANEAEYARILAAEFNSITAENDMKWKATEPKHKTYTWNNADAVAAFATAYGQTVRGHTLVWANEFQFQVIPDYVRNAVDVATMQQYIDDHIEAVVTRYADVVDRWDVINEPLETLGPGVDQNVITATLGEAWMLRAFQQARALDPTADLYVNESLTTLLPAKHAGLLALVKRLIDAGAPIDGVGLQAHYLGGQVPAALQSVMEDWQALGLKVAVTELDIATAGGDLQSHATGYASVFATCLAVSACVEVTSWGFTDRHTWLNDFIGPESTPLLFNEDYQPKPAYTAVAETLAGD